MFLPLFKQNKTFVTDEVPVFLKVILSTRDTLVSFFSHLFLLLVEC